MMIKFFQYLCGLLGHDGPTIECGRTLDRICLRCGKICNEQKLKKEIP